MDATTDTFALGPYARWIAAAVLLVGCGDDVTSASASGGSAESTAASETAGSTGGASISDGSGSQDGTATTSGASSGNESETTGRTDGTGTQGRTSGASDTDETGGGSDSGDTDTTTGSESDSEDTETTGGSGGNELCGPNEDEAFYDDFTADIGQWVLDPKWTYADGGAWGQMAGDGVMASTWNIGGGGCPTTQRVVMTDAIDIGAAATLRFAHSGELAAFDTLRVIASTDDGATWEEVIAYDENDGPTAVEAAIEVDVSAFSGAVRFGFEYDNVCGDPLGVTWVLDDVAVCQPQPPAQCEAGQVVAFTDDFEADNGDWVLGTHWSYDDGANFSQPGDGVMAGYWDILGAGAGCPTTQRVELAESVDLFGDASLSFSQAAQLATNDTLFVLASTDDGATWEVIGEYDNTVGLTLAAESNEFIDLAAVIGVGGAPVRIAFEFENICGDALGVEWGLDDVVLCSDPVPS